MTAANKDVFARLIAFAERAQRPLENADKARWIKTDEDSKLWLKNLAVKKVERITSRMGTAVIEYNGQSLFVTVGFEEIDEVGANSITPDEVLSPIQLNAGMFTALIQKLDVQVHQFVEPLEVIENLLPQFSEVEGYNGHNFSTVAKYFEPLGVYKIRLDSPISTGDLPRLTSYWVIRNKERIVLPISVETLEVLERLVLNGAQTIPFDNLLNTCQSSQWRHAFLESYRCIEMLFSFQIIEGLYTELSISIPLIQFASKIESIIGWRPAEADAIERLCGFLPDEAKNLFENVKTQDTGKTGQKISVWLYELRNSVVHFRPATRQINLNDAQWDEILRATLLLIEKIYANYDQQLQAA